MRTAIISICTFFPSMVVTKVNALRDQFLLDPTVVFLNHGSFGACPRPVFETYQRWQLELERQPVEFLGRRHDELLKKARESLGAYLNVGADDLIFVPMPRRELTRSCVRCACSPATRS